MPRLPAYYGRGNSQTTLRLFYCCGFDPLGIDMTSDLPSPITTLTPAQQAQVINLVRRAAQSGIMPRYQNLSNFEIKTKSRDDDLVTQADLDAEAMITRGLLRSEEHT